MAKNNEIIVKEVAVKTIKHGNVDYICMTDIARMKNAIDPNGVIANWMRNRNTIEFLGIWETLYNPNFNPLEFEGIRAEAGLNAFTMSPTRWVECSTIWYYRQRVARCQPRTQRQYARLCYYQSADMPQQHGEYQCGVYQ